MSDTAFFLALLIVSTASLAVGIMAGFVIAMKGEKK